MGETGETFFILFKNGAPADWLGAGEVFSRNFPAVAAPEAARACRKGFGLVSIPLKQEPAEDVAKALDEAGYPALAISSEQVVKPPKPVVLPTGAAQEEGLLAPANTQGDARVLPWSLIRIVCVACVKPAPEAGEGGMLGAEIKEQDSPTLESALGTGVGLLGLLSVAGPAGVLVGMKGALAKFKPAPEKLVKPKTAEPEDWLELFGTEPLLRLRIRRGNFRYDYLGPRLAPTSRANFKLLLGDVARFAPHAAAAGQVEAALAGRNLNDPFRVLPAADHEACVSALLTREILTGLPR